jgi:hypothetical protein
MTFQEYIDQFWGGDEQAATESNAGWGISGEQAGQMASGWGKAGLLSYLQDDWKPLGKQAAREGMDYGLKNYGGDWLTTGSGGYTPLGSGLSGAGTTLATGLLTGETDGLAGKTAMAGAGNYAGNYVGQQAAQNVAASGGSRAAATTAGNAAGAGVGGIATGAYELATQGKVSKSTEWGTVGAMLGTVVPGIGNVVGGLIGSLAGAFLASDKPKIKKSAKFDSGTGVVWDGKKFSPQRPDDVSVMVNGEEVKLNDQQKAGVARELYQKELKSAQELNERFAGKDYGQMNAKDAYEFDRYREMYTPATAPKSEEEMRKAYNEYSHNLRPADEMLNQDGFHDFRMEYDEFKEKMNKGEWQWQDSDLNPHYQKVWGAKYRTGDWYGEGAFRNQTKQPEGIKKAVSVLEKTDGTGYSGDTPWYNYQQNGDTYSGGHAGAEQYGKENFYNTYKDKDPSTLSASVREQMNMLRSDPTFQNTRKQQKPVVKPVARPTSPIESATMARNKKGLLLDLEETDNQAW